MTTTPALQSNIVQTLPCTQFSTMGLPPADAFGIWHDAISVVFAASRDAPPDAPFQAEVEAFNCGDLLFTRFAFGAQRFARTPRMARRDGMDHFILHLYRSGGYHGEVGARPLALNAGEISLLDLTKPLATQAQDSDTLALLIPRHLLEPLLPTDALHGHALRGTAAALYCDHLLALQRRLPTLSASDAPIVVRAVVELLAGLVRPGLHTSAAHTAQQELALHRARRYIEAHLHYAQLSLDDVRAAAAVSRASLYRLFEGVGGVAHYVLVRRLERCRAVLENPCDRRRISEIAYAHGFVSEAHFSRAFRRRYGQTPGEVRAASESALPSATVPAGPSMALDDTFDGWIRRFQRG